MVARIQDHPFYAGGIPTPYTPDPALLAIVSIIREGLLRDQHVRLQNFGTFRLRWSKPRKIKHPKTGEYVTAPPAPKITFTPAKHLREAIEPNPKPVIPLAGPVKPIAHSTLTVVTALDSDDVEEPPSLHENIQDIIDEQYQPHKITETSEDKFPNKKWALGILAAVPLMLVMLQADFSNDTSQPQTNAQPATAQVATIQSTTPQSTTTQSATAQSATAESTRVESTGLELTQTEVIKAAPQLAEPVTPHTVVRTDSVVLDSPLSTEESDTKAKPTIASTLRPEPQSKSFYMSPQLHEVQQGDNLWALAKQFYGDALLWPHIYRANTRTIQDPDKIQTGHQIVIPGLQQSPDALSSKDRALVAEGYFQVYQFTQQTNPEQAVYFLIGAKQYSFDWLQTQKSYISRKDWNVIKNSSE